MRTACWHAEWHTARSGRPPAEAMEDLCAAEPMLDEYGDPLDAVLAQSTMSLVLVCRGDYRTATSRLLAALTRLRTLAAEPDAAKYHCVLSCVFQNLALLAHHTGDTDAMHKYNHQARTGFITAQRAMRSRPRASRLDAAGSHMDTAGSDTPAA